MKIYKFKIIDLNIDDINFKLFEDFYEKCCYEQISFNVRVKYLFYLLDLNRIEFTINFCKMMVKHNSNTLNFTRCFFIYVLKYKRLLNFYKENIQDMLFLKKEIRLQEYNSKSSIDKLNYKILIDSTFIQNRYNEERSS